MNSTAEIRLREVRIAVLLWSEMAETPTDTALSLIPYLRRISVWTAFIAMSSCSAFLRWASGTSL